MNFFRYLGFRIFKRTMSVLPQEPPLLEKYNLEKVLLISKTTRFELEQQHRSNADMSELREMLIERGSGSLLKSHEKHKEFEKELISSLEKLNVEVKIIDRYERPSELLNWADTIISVGGDGTFLMAANKVVDQLKPVIGFNSCPETSTGYLCLPKSCSQNIFKTLTDIKQHRFTWAYRSRIQVIMYGKNINKSTFSVHDKMFKRKISNWETMDKEDNVKEETYVLPHLALNEVFIAESTPASVSYLDIAVNDDELITTKSSGICVCTGSGSSSWNFTMNRISSDVVQKICSLSNSLTTNIDEVVEKYNNSLRFVADDERLHYTIRDMIPVSNWPKMPDLPSKGLVRKIIIRSQCHDGNLVIDGGCSYQFNAGTTAILGTDKKHILKTIKLKDTNVSNE